MTYSLRYATISLNPSEQIAEKEILLLIIKFKSFLLNTLSSKTLGGVLGLFWALWVANRSIIVDWLEGESDVSNIIINIYINI